MKSTVINCHYCGTKLRLVIPKASRQRRFECPNCNAVSKIANYGPKSAADGIESRIASSDADRTSLLPEDDLAKSEPGSIVVSPENELEEAPVVLIGFPRRKDANEENVLDEPGNGKEAIEDVTHEEAPDAEEDDAEAQNTEPEVDVPLDAATLVVHQPMPHGEENGVFPRGDFIYQSSLFSFKTVEDMIDVMAQKKPGYSYTRSGNPNFRAVEKTLAKLDKTEEALVFASGLAAIATTIFATVRPGERMVIGSHLYGGTVQFFNRVGKDQGFELVPVDYRDPDALAEALTTETKAAYFETPTNPHNHIVDLDMVSRLCRERGIVSIIDNTFATPIFQRPAEYGIDIIVHSGTKYFGGHSDLMCGAVCGSEDRLKSIRSYRLNLGGVLNGFDAWLMQRGIKTLALRMERHGLNSLFIARELSKHPKVRAAYYPFLESNPGYSLARKQMSGGGAIVSFELDGGFDEAKRFVNALKLFARGPSLGGVESLASIPAFGAHRFITQDQRDAMGVADNLIRLSIGIESKEDLWRDLANALRLV
ncbi:MAG: PLP-dependent transferase [Planctomycetes bacterium]|nr:PLP-dependent transferase [Planctomycetota bacterium]